MRNRTFGKNYATHLQMGSSVQQAVIIPKDLTDSSIK